MVSLGLLTTALSGPPINLQQLLKDLSPASCWLKSPIVAQPLLPALGTTLYRLGDPGNEVARLDSQPLQSLLQGHHPCPGSPAAASPLPRTAAEPQHPPDTHTPAPTLSSVNHTPNRGPHGASHCPASLSPDPRLLFLPVTKPVDSASLSSPRSFCLSPSPLLRSNYHHLLLDLTADRGWGAEGERVPH